MKITNEQLISMLPLIYYGSKVFTTDQKPVLNLNKISKALSVSSTKLRSIIKLLQTNKNATNINPIGRLPKLQQQHINFLVSQGTLIQWAGFSLKERLKLFHRQYPDLTISYSYLQRLYRKYKIKFKVIRQKKLVSKIPEQKLFHLTKLMIDTVKDCIQRNIKIIFVDEAIFSPQTMLERQWSSLYSNIEQLDLRFQLKTQALVCGISQQKGLESYCIQPSSINSDSFIDFLHQLRHSQTNNDQIAVFMDNLAVHKTQKVLTTMQELNMISIFSVPYSPQYNGIESYFFLIKQQYKRILLQKTIREEELDIRKMMESAIRLVQDEKAKNCCLGSLKIILNQDQFHQ